MVIRRSITQRNTGSAFATQRLFLTVAGAIFDQRTARKRIAIVPTVGIWAIQGIPVHPILPKVEFDFRERYEKRTSKTELSIKGSEGHYLISGMRVFFRRQSVALNVAVGQRVLCSRHNSVVQDFVS